MGCKYKNKCPSCTGWCSGPKQDFKGCVPFLITAYEREKKRKEELQKQFDLFILETIAGDLRDLLDEVERSASIRREGTDKRKEKLMIRIFKIEDEKCYEKEIVGDLESLQKELGCSVITLVPYFPELEEEGIDIYADDNGLLIDDPRINLVRFDDFGKIKYAVFRHVVFMGHDGNGDTIGLSQKQMDFIHRYLRKVVLTEPNSGNVMKCFTFDF